jgi:predicted DNA-binding ribbon-helix-helix protein
MNQQEHVKKSVVFKHSIFINGRKTSVSLENAFWHGLREIADQENMTVPMLIEQIDRNRNTCNLSSAIRLFVFNHLRSEKHKLQAQHSPTRQGAESSTQTNDISER